MDLMSELKINTEKKHMTLEQAITKGADALIPYEFDYPNTDFVVEVRLKPITNKELANADQLAKVNPDTTVDLELLKMAVFNTDDTAFENETIENLPAGVVMDLAWKICDISGIDFNKIRERTSSSAGLEGF